MPVSLQGKDTFKHLLKTCVKDLRILKCKLRVTSKEQSYICVVLFPCFYIYLFSRHFYPKRITNYNGSNQNPQKSNDMQVQ